MKEKPLPIWLKIVAVASAVALWFAAIRWAILFEVEGGDPSGALPAAAAVGPIIVWALVLAWHDKDTGTGFPFSR